jgi:hypothetical protein
MAVLDLFIPKIYVGESNVVLDVIQSVPFKVEPSAIPYCSNCGKTTEK